MFLRVNTRQIRILFQVFTFGLWVSLLWATKHPMDSWIAQNIPVSLFLRIDPLVLTVVSGGMRMGISILMLGFVTLLVSLLLGRVFCGWVCPLGSIFDAYGWFLKKIKIPIEGPSPTWFRLKYYLLAVILTFALFGGVSPLMGLDPIVLLTRSVASVFDPVLELKENIISYGFFQTHAGSASFAWFIDSSSLVLFFLIMAGTTKLSRVWCRAVCPLGAYLAVLSRNSVLRRQTDGCVHCNLCSKHCPTGAISFENAEVYNESECIKCFVCSDECPVDVNYFTLESPLPTFRATTEPVSLKRRTLLSSVALGVASTPVLNLSSGAPLANKKLIRPPMSREENDFLKSCIRCQECVKACPTGVLKSASLDHGIRSLWSPTMVASEASCLEGCNACSQACPTNAILKYPIENKYDFKSGTAVFESSKCISYSENKYCSECIRACPTDAIAFEKAWEPQSESLEQEKGSWKKGIFPYGSDQPAPENHTPTRPLRISYERCVGCGACETECNKIVFGEPAMVLTSYGRAKRTNLTDTKPESTQAPLQTPKRGNL